LSFDTNSIRRILPEQDNGIGVASPAFSPDGKWLAFASFEHPNNCKKVGSLALSILHRSTPCIL
jgi:Tol biopolymer transport system component